MDEGGGLENRYTGDCIVGSNPTPSASFEANNRPLSGSGAFDLDVMSTNSFSGLWARRLGIPLGLPTGRL